MVKISGGQGGTCSQADGLGISLGFQPWLPWLCTHFWWPCVQIQAGGEGVAMHPFILDHPGSSWSGGLPLPPPNHQTKCGERTDMTVFNTWRVAGLTEKEKRLILTLEIVIDVHSFSDMTHSKGNKCGLDVKS